MTIQEKLAALRAEMKKENISIYLVPTADDHGSEYLGDHFKCREYLTGFTGSAGDALILPDAAYLWTDGRYFLQAETQLKDTGIRLMKSGEEGVPSMEAFIMGQIKAGQSVGCSGRLLRAGFGTRLEKLLKEKTASLRTEPDLCDVIWPDRPALSCRPVWELTQEYAGKPRAEKLRDLQCAMEKEGCDVHVLTSLDDIAWLLNLRGDDIAYNPVFFSFLIVTKEEVRLYAQREAFCGRQNTDAEAHQGTFRSDSTSESDHDTPYSDLTGESDCDMQCGDLMRALETDHVTLRSYDSFYRDLEKLPENSRVLLDSTAVNYAAWTALSHTKRIDRPNPTTLAKAVKNPAEMEHMRNAHLKDGIAMCRFLFWIKNALQTHAASADECNRRDQGFRQNKQTDCGMEEMEYLTEISCAQKLESFRQQQEHYIGPGFETIAAYGPHGAIVHYAAAPETNIPLKKGSFLLVDSGGQYLDGTTDVTRTIVCGALTREEKETYTRVLRGNLNLTAACFRYGCSGEALDYLARAPLWEAGLDYNHGTGHGVGFCLNVHEGPNRFSFRPMPRSGKPWVFEEGMITSDEPGFYREGRFGVRLENLLLCVKAEKTEYGQFMKFEPLTLVPWDLDAVDPDMLSEQEKHLLNTYHKTVFEKIAPHLQEAERSWLRKATREI